MYAESFCLHDCPKVNALLRIGKLYFFVLLNVANSILKVISRLCCLDDQQDSLKELDVALSQMKSSPHFPQASEYF